jgi:septin family protein
MKSAYELAMERLQQQAPGVSLTAAQKAAIAELESRHRAQVAQREIGLGAEIETAEAAGEQDQAVALRQQLAAEKRKLEAELEEKKERVRRG